MLATGARLHAAALLGYLLVALAFAWPLPLQLSTALLGPPGGDTGVYVWNLWVFRHEIVENGRLPFFTSQILAATPAVPLTLHNYTTLANIAAFPLQPLIGTIATFNVLTLASSALSAYMMFVFLRHEVGDRAAAWIGGLLFGFSPFMTARQMAHFSLVQAAALPAFALVLLRIRADGATVGLSVAAGAAVAWAFLSDPYYAVYCALIALLFVGWETVAIRFRPGTPRLTVRAALDLGIAIVGALVVAILLRGGGAFELFGLRVSMTRLYTPVLLLTVLVLARVLIGLRPHVTWYPWRFAPFGRAGLLGALTCLALLAPLLTAIAQHAGQQQWIAPPVFWRSSAPGIDLLALLAPNPVGTLFGPIAVDWLRRMPDGLYEHVASVPWTAIGAVSVAALAAGLRLPRYWLAFTAGAALLALGPFVHIAGVNTHVPTPWAVMRYLPVVGAARMPTRLTVLVMLGAAVLLAYAVKALRARAARPWVPTMAVAVLLLVELFPAPRSVYPVRVPRFLEIVAADTRPVSVLHLPTGLRDGISSAGDFSAYAQLLQTFHGKRLVGGYLSRLPEGEVGRYRRLPLMSVLLDLSEGKVVEPERLARARERAPEIRRRLKLAYVIVDRHRAPADLVAFAVDALHLELVETDGGQELYSVR